MDIDGEVRDLPGARKASRLKGVIEFEHVNFAYDPKSPILEDVSFRIEAGQVAAFVGPTARERRRSSV